jgi:ATP-dependent protease ClpP protease subunit
MDVLNTKHINRINAEAAKHFKITNSAQGTAVVEIFSEISDWWGFGLHALKWQLRDISPTEIEVKINSYGGEVFEGVAIANYLKQHTAKITTNVIGVAASIASIIAIKSADVVTMCENTFLMIHRPAGGTFGNSEDLRGAADLIDLTEEDLISVYVNKIKANNKLINDSEEETVAQVKEWLAAETWFTASKALEVGLIDEINGVAGEYVTDSEQEKMLDTITNTYKNAPIALVNHVKNFRKMAIKNEEKKGFLENLKSYFKKNPEHLQEITNAAEEEQEEEETPTAEEIAAAKAVLEKANLLEGNSQEEEEEEQEEEEEEEEEVVVDNEEAIVARLKKEIKAELQDLDSDEDEGTSGFAGGHKGAGKGKGKMKNKAREKALNKFGNFLVDRAKRG